LKREDGKEMGGVGECRVGGSFKKKRPPEKKSGQKETKEKEEGGGKRTQPRQGRRGGKTERGGDRKDADTGLSRSGWARILHAFGGG